MNDLHADPVVYDILQTPGTAREVDALERVERAYGRRTGFAERSTWWEPACGTGRYLRVAARRGHRVIGCDIRPEMITYARRRLEHLRIFGEERAHLFVGDITASDLAARAGVNGKNAADPPEAADGVADLAFIPVNSLRLLESDQEMLAHLDQIARILRPGGIYVVGISLNAAVSEAEDELAVDAQPEEDVWVATRGRCRVRQVVNYLPPAWSGLARREVVISHLMVERPGGVVHDDDRYELRTYTAEQWRDLIAQSPLAHIATLDPDGRATGRRVLPYQLEILRHER
jgi:SAM-dependent methyltransferase